MKSSESSQAAKEKDTAQSSFLLPWKLEFPYLRQWQCHDKYIGNDVRNRLSDEICLNIDTMACNWGPRPEEMNRSALENGGELRSNPREGDHCSHSVKISSKRRSWEDTGIQKENGEL